MVHYMLTISCQQKKSFIVKSDLKEVVLWLKMNIHHLKVYTHVYETSGGYNQLHFHAIVDVKHNFSYRPFTKWGDIDFTHHTFRVQWTKIVDLQGAYHYLYKDQHYNNQDEILIRNLYKHYYFDIDNQQFILA